MPKGYPTGLFPAQSCPAAFSLPQGGPSPTNLSQPATNHSDLASPGPPCACVSCNAMPKGYTTGLFPAPSCPSAQNPLSLPFGGPSPTYPSHPAANHADLASPNPLCLRELQSSAKRLPRGAVPGSFLPCCLKLPYPAKGDPAPPTCHTPQHAQLDYSLEQQGWRNQYEALMEAAVSL